MRQRAEKTAAEMIRERRDFKGAPGVLNLTQNKRTMERYIRIWIRRIIRDPGWDIQIVADRSIPGHRRAESCSVPANRTATISYNPEILARNRTACHEVLHVALGGARVVADNVAEELPDVAARMYQARLTEAHEGAVEILTEAFLAAYGEKP